ncbi:MAG: hypothetical protein GY832_07545 [Chloroflexi bacterium]|nr:hypothetical protein [Chloroflexota bacterium]
MGIDLEKEKKRLLEISENIRQAHFELDADAMVSAFADPVIRVARGAISRIPREDARQNYREYFQDSVYHEMDELEPSIVRVSQDATMAWVISRTKVRLTYKTESGDEAERAFIYAGIVTYEKQDGEWVRTSNVATIE